MDESNSIEQMLSSTLLKDLKSVTQKGSDIGHLQRLKSDIGAVLDKCHPLQGSSDHERRKIKKFRRTYDGLLDSFEEQAARTRVVEPRNIAEEERVLTTPLTNSRDNFNTKPDPVPDSYTVTIYEDNPARQFLSDTPSFPNSMTRRRRTGDGGSSLHPHVHGTRGSETTGYKQSIYGLMVIAVNFIAEVAQAAISGEKNDGKMGDNLYREISIIISAFCLAMVFIEAFLLAQKHGVVLKKRGLFRRGLFYGDDEGRPFGNLHLYFGFTSSMIQLIFHVTEKLVKKDIIKFEFMPLLLAGCYLVAGIIDYRREDSRTDESRLLGSGDNPARVEV